MDANEPPSHLEQCVEPSPSSVMASGFFWAGALVCLAFWIGVALLFLG